MNCDLSVGGVLPYDVNRQTILFDSGGRMNETNVKVIQAIGLLAKGTPRKEVAEATGLNLREVDAIAEESRKEKIPGTVGRMTHEQRRSRRREIKKFIAECRKGGVVAGEMYDQIAAKWGISRLTAQAYAIGVGDTKNPKCKPNREAIPAKQLAGFFADLARGEKMATAGRKIGVSRQRAEVLRNEAVQAGLFDAILNFNRAAIQRHIDKVRGG